jgi:DNA-binding NtrC family response regulator
LSDKATIRRQATAELGRDAGRLAILWVFPELAGRLSFLPAGRTVLGRDEAADICLPGDETSRQHAEIVKEGPMIVLRDLNSTNGVFVDGERMTRGPIDEGSVVRIGDWIGVLVRTASDAQDSPMFREIAPGYFGGLKTRAVMDPVRTAAPSDLPVIVEAETGSGKEGVSRAVHAWSGRTGPLVAVNCAALPEALAEGELFGYRKGAFTGADRSNPGYFQAAHKGTLFLDEVADLPPAIQPKLLRVLEQREVTPLGEARAVPVDVRIVVATQSPLSDAVVEKRFRGDLFARLNGLQVRLPPLRARVEEVPYLFTRLLSERADAGAPRLDPGLVERLCCHDWPFNIRELSLLVRRLLALYGREGVLKRAHLPETMTRARAAKVGQRGGAPTMDDAELARRADAEPELLGLELTAGQLDERRRIIQVLEECAGSQTEAAKRFDLSRSTFIERLKQYRIPRPRAGRD